MAYIGNSPGVASQRVETAFTATSNQTSFTPSSGYTLGYCDVYQNGVKLVNGDDYTASDGATVTLATGAASGDSIVIVASFPRGLSDGYLKSEADAKYLTIANPSYTGTLTGGTGAITIGTNQFVKDSSGNIGIGTASPATRLHLYAAANEMLRLEASSTSYDAALRIFQNGTQITNLQGGVGVTGGGTFLTTVTSAPLVFGTANTERVRIDASGNLLLNTTTGYGKFTVQNNAGTGKVLLDNYVSIPTTENVLSIYADASRGYIQSYNNGYKDIAICASGGNLLVGTTTANTKFVVGATTQTGAEISAYTTNTSGGDTSKLSFWRNYSTGSTVPYRAAYISNWNYDDSNSSSNRQGIVFATKSGTSEPTERLRIDGTGNLLVNTTASSGIDSGLGLRGVGAGNPNRNTGTVVSWGATTAGGLPQYVGNWPQSGYWGVGHDSGSGGLRLGVCGADGNGWYWTGYAAVYGGAYTNASDYRLKENVVTYSENAISKVMALRPVLYNMIDTAEQDPDYPSPQPKTEIGFLAHEFQEHVPELVSGEKDGVESDGSPRMQGIDYAKFTAVLVKAIQEQQAIIEQLQADVATLKGTP